MAGNTAGAENASARAPQLATSARLRAARRGSGNASPSAQAPESRPAMSIACGSPAYAINARATPAQASRLREGASTIPTTASAAMGTLPAPME
ncbi:MAG: hypothetical protein E6J86_18685 [Deltaproteobacteria bacterium]|nr:MAG: hypothetical protein E6J86_18685 [Deltaproteobacteria bacterium]